MRYRLLHTRQRATSNRQLQTALFISDKTLTSEQLLGVHKYTQMYNEAYMQMTDSTVGQRSHD